MPDIKVMFESYAFFGNNLFLNDINISGTVGIAEHPNSGLSATLHPNPTDGQFVLSVKGGHREITMQVINSQGQVMRTQIFQLKSGALTRQLDFTGYPRGVYSIRLTDAITTQVQKLVIR